SPAQHASVASSPSATAEDAAARGAELGQSVSRTGTASLTATAGTADAVEGASAKTARRSADAASVDDGTALVSAETLTSPKIAIAILAVWLLGSIVVVTAWLRRWMMLATLAHGA